MMIAAMMALAAVSADPATGCAAVRAVLPQSGVCVEGQDGIVLGRDEAASRVLLDQAQLGAQRFRATFGRDPSRYAVFDFDDPATVQTTATALRKLGFRAVLPLPSEAARQRQMADALRQFQGGQAGAAAPRIVRREAPGGQGEPRNAGFVPHELGHKWYADVFWPTAPAGGSAPIRRYGSAAPDWLDEAAAMMMEDADGTRSYVQRFADGRSTDMQRAAAIPPEIPLATLIAMDHPALAGMPASAGTAAPVFAIGKPSLFYAEVRVFADYLTERSGDARIIATISNGLRDGATFDGWLRAYGKAHHLSESLPTMQADWENWLDRRFGKVADAR